jgi:hypothetical protein
MADNMRMARAEAGCKCGQGGGPLFWQLVPAVAKGPCHPQGRSERASGVLRAAELTGNGAVGGSQRVERSPVVCCELLTRTSGMWFFSGCQDPKENQSNG